MENINNFFKMNSKNFYYFILVAIVLAIFCFLFIKNDNNFKKVGDNEVKFVKIAGQIVKVDLALTQKAQEQGLSGRKSLGEDEGMLFIFPKPSINYFWMKDMNFPIDIIWIDNNLKVIFIKKNAQPSSYPDSFGPGVDNRYVLEVSAGFSEKNNLKEGNRVEFLR